jgi:hypothetical protein
MNKTLVNTDFENLPFVNYDMVNNSKYSEIWKNQGMKLNEILHATNEDTDVVTIAVQGFGKGLCPSMGWVVFDYMKKEDYPHGIFENSMYFRFKVDFTDNKVELSDYGHCYLSPYDMKTEKYRYYAMRSAVEITESDYGVKKFRKYHFKDLETLAKKMQEYCKNAMVGIKDYTGGYPFHQGIKTFKTAI